MELNAELPMAPVGMARARGAVLRPAASLARRVRGHGPAVRAGGRGRARRVPAPQPASAGACCRSPSRGQWRVVAEVPDWNMRVFECDAGRGARLHRLVGRGLAAPSDLAWQRDALFDPALPDDVRAAGGDAAAVGPRQDHAEPPTARIVEDGATTVDRRGVGAARRALWSCAIPTIRRGRPRWTASRRRSSGSNGLYRAVALPPGPARDTVFLPAARPRHAV